MDARYAVFQEEVGENGTRHLQGYIEFPSPRRMAWIKEHMEDDTVHLEKAMGTPEQCRDYCTKEETRVGGPYEFGSLKKNPGKRNENSPICARLAEIVIAVWSRYPNDRTIA